MNTFNEWDPLEEVIVGTVDGASVPPWHVALEATMPSDQWDFFKQFGGRRFSQDTIEAAARDLEGFVGLLEREGVTVQRPDPVEFSKPYCTLDWASAGGLYAAMPRDVLLVVGDEIIEAPMAWRSRYFEVNAYRRLLRYYFHHGARWIAAPKPQLPDELYRQEYDRTPEGRPESFVITEFEPTFDAADCIRCGRDLFVQRSHVTNAFGIQWLRSHFAGKLRVHEVEFKDPHPMHVDATVMPLAPGKLLVNPERVRSLPDVFEGWDMLKAPRPSIPASHTLHMTSKWLSMNVLSLDERRVIVESREEPLMEALVGWGFEPIPCEFRNFNSLGGSFHCATVDIRRNGCLRDYF